MKPARRPLRIPSKTRIAVQTKNLRTRKKKSTIFNRHWFIDDSDGRNAAGYCVCAGHVESLHVSVATAPPGRPAAIVSLCQSHAIGSHCTSQWSQLIGDIGADLGGSVVTEGAYSTS
ncbi:hypothetical protein PITC_095340 [Penicillium italicum]|uniref:Uncharacterized protein n=1 Tax=Penicillium italicum TaxID=40296 RepID=A0A0A2KND6_PENIT|nr:hypothetical protein PITC_095340 [Penicillium italicum]